MRKRLFFCFFIILGLATITHAATEDATVHQFVNSDFIPPTTPGPITTTPVATDQINLTWVASTDNYLMGGYQVFRDAVPIATTTQTSYSDTGLEVETLYTYTVRAFDYVGLYSSSSAPASTTTLPIPPIPGYRTYLDLTTLKVEPTVDTALLTWGTDRPTRYELRWGETLSYELGFVTNQTYQHINQTLITDLEPDTRYQYELIAYEASGDRWILSRDTFTTLSPPDVTPPPNITNFVAMAEGDDAVLTWKNPAADFDHVRIVRNPLFYPTDPNNGYVIYEGPAERFVDEAVLSSQPKVYYTAFAYDASANRSSGAITEAVKPDALGPGGGQRGTGSLTTSPGTGDGEVDETLGQSPLSISLENVVIWQFDELIRLTANAYLVDTEQSFTIQAPFELFPRHLKAIRVTLSHPADATQSNSFLMRINQEGTAYETTVSNLEYHGTIPFELTVYDYETKEVASARASIISTQREPERTVVNNIIPWYTDIWWLLILLFILLLLWWFYGSRRRRDQ